MSKNKLCLQINIAPHYRESIFKLIDEAYSCDWYFGENLSNIKTMDLSALKKVTILPNKVLFKKIFFRKGLSGLLNNKGTNTYILTAESFNLSMWLFLIKARLFYPQKKIYLWTHGWYGKEKSYEKILKKIYLKLATGIFLYGNYAKQLMIKEGFASQKLFVIHNSLQYDKHLEIRKNLVPTKIFIDHFKNENKNLIFIGRLTSIKRLDLLIKVISIAEHNNDCYNLIFVGDGPMKEQLIDLAQSLGLSNRIWFFGACYDDQKNAELIYNADLCVSPGNVGLTAIHSMTFGTPVITHDNFAYQMPEFETIVPNITGDFFKQNNTNSIVECIHDWFENHPSREVVRENCYKEIESSWNPQYQMEILKLHLDLN